MMKVPKFLESLYKNEYKIFNYKVQVYMELIKLKIEVDSYVCLMLYGYFIVLYFLIYRFLGTRINY